MKCGLWLPGEAPRPYCNSSWRLLGNLLIVVPPVSENFGLPPAQFYLEEATKMTWQADMGNGKCAEEWFEPIMEAIKENIAEIRQAHRWWNGRREIVDLCDIELRDLDSQKNVSSGIVREMHLSRGFKVRRRQTLDEDVVDPAAVGAAFSQDAVAAADVPSPEKDPNQDAVAAAAAADLPIPAFVSRSSAGASSSQVGW